MRGVKLRMGELRYQNEPLASAMILGLDQDMEKIWNASASPKEQEAVEELMVFICIRFGADLRGKEVTLASLKGMLHFWSKTKSDPVDPFIMITLHGRFKGETGFWWHCLPICNDNRSGIPIHF